MMRRHNEDGFTLVELLVSLTLLSLMAIYALNAFSSLRSINRVVDVIGHQMEVEAVSRHLRGAIADMRPVLKQDPNSTAKLMFNGEHKALAFVVSADGEREIGGLYFVRYFLNQKSELIVARQLLQDKILSATTELVLLRGVKTLTFQYFDQDDLKQPKPEWLNWDRLPSSIGVDIDFEMIDKRKWRQTNYRVYLNLRF